jgi:hypothetical protein
VDVNTYLRPGISACSIPGVRPDATVLAQFNGGLVAVAINANKNVVAINDFPSGPVQSLYKLVANAALSLANKI